MSVNTLVKDGLLSNLNVDVTTVPIDVENGQVNYNPGLARDPKGTLWVSIRSCVTNLELFKNMEHPNHYRNYLHVGILDEKNLTISKLKEMKPEEEYEGFQWGIEDVRLFWRDDGLHGIGVIIPITEDGKYGIRQAEIIIDYKKGTYKYIKDHGRPFGHAEKNWMPSEKPNPHFDFIYSPTQIVKNDKVIGEENELFIHNGTPLIPYQSGYISIGHSVCSLFGERTYAQIALYWNAKGKLLWHSQFFHFNVGWREQLQETIEFASGLVWSKGKGGEELLVGIGIKDEIPGFARVPVSKFKWFEYSDTTWYAWRWDTPPNRIEIPSPKL